MRFRYSLRTLLIVTLVVGVGIGTYMKWTEHERSVAALQKLGVYVPWIEYASVYPSPSQRLPTAERYSEARFFDPWPGTAADYQKLRGVRRLKVVELDSYRNRYDEVFPVLPELKDFTKLHCVALQLNEANLASLKNCPNLRTLHVNAATEGIQISGAINFDEFRAERAARPLAHDCLRHLPELTQLRTLHIWGDQIDRELLEILGRCQALESLGLHPGELADGDLRPLRGLTSVRSLRFSVNSVSSGDCLHDLPANVVHMKLEWSLRFTIEPEVFAHFRKLRTLQISTELFATDFIDRLQQLDLPELRAVTLIGNGTTRYFVREQGRALWTATEAEVAALEEAPLAGP